MAIIHTRKVRVLKVGEIELSPKDAKRKWARATLQLFTGDTAGSFPVYAADAEKNTDDLTSMKEGDYLLDIIERGGQYGIELVYANPRPFKDQPQQTAKV